MRQFLLLCALLTSFLSINVVFADDFPDHEQISTFDSTINVHTDASITITEKITVFANGKIIKRGLVRMLPKSYRDSYGINHHTVYHLISVELNGQKTPYHIKESRSKFSIYVGAKNIRLNPGWYEYTFKYQVNDAINFLKDADELYWNITGNEWALPINSASATIMLPTGADITHYRGYTGKKGSKGENYSVQQISPTSIEFQTTQPLPVRNGLTIAVAWPKGIITEPSFMQRMNNRLELNAGSYIVIEITFITLLYFLFVWNLYGRDPKKGTIFPRFTPPENVRPAQARFLMRMGFDMKSATSYLIWLATGGYIHIENTDRTFKLTKLNKNTSALDAEDNALLNTLFASKDSIELKSANRNEFIKFQRRLKTQLAKYNNGRYFHNNTKFLIPGILLFVLSAISAIFFASNIVEAAFAIVWLSGWTAGTFYLLYQAWILFNSAWQAPSITTLFGALAMCAFCIPFTIGEIIGITLLSQFIPIFTIPFLFLTMALNVIFYVLMKQPTADGRKLMDEIEGFKMFLSTTDRYRLKDYTPPEITEELYEKYLAYAIALDVENNWGEQFNHQLIAAGKAPNTYHPTWYSGKNWSSSSPAAFGTILAAGLSSSLSSTSVSSSASGGGGSSGGGGGGGGGGGW